VKFVKFVAKPFLKFVAKAFLAVEAAP